MARVLSHDQAKDFYDRFGRKQDLQSIYEDPAIDALLRHAEFGSAHAVVELGCGTGRLAERLLDEELPQRATYIGLDISSTMVDLAQRRVARWSNRAAVRKSDGSLSLDLDDGSQDRFVCTYVLDLLSEADIREVFDEARRVLRPGGRLCLASLTHGTNAPSRALCRAWSAIHALNPKLVGGCRPLDLVSFAESWHVLHHEVICTLGICTEVLVATPPSSDGHEERKGQAAS